MLRGVRALAFCVFLCTGSHAFANVVIRYDAVGPSAQSLCCNVATNRAISIEDITPKIYTEWSSPAQPTPAWTNDDTDVRSHGPSWTFFLVITILLITAKTALLFRPVHRASVAYARLYWDVFNPLEF
jgi:hypothetical protein